MAGRGPAVSFSTSLQNISSPFPLLFGMIEADTVKVILSKQKRTLLWQSVHFVSDVF